MLYTGLTPQFLNSDPVDENKTFTLELCEICVKDEVVSGLLLDLECLHDMAKELGEDHRGYQALYTANQMINKLINNEWK